MPWFSTSDSAGHLGAAVSRFNDALDLLERDGAEVDIACCLSESLNRIQTEWSRDETHGQMAQDGLQVVLAQGLCPEAKEELLGSAEVAGLAGFEAAESGKEWDHSLAKLAGMMCVVRRPGFGKAERDKAFSRTVIPVQRLLINLLLDKPDERLVIYGTLAPGKANHHVIADLSGSWDDCIVRGRISEVDGLPYFTWTPSQGSLRARLFSSEQLPANWDDLDLFEGDGYKRRLIPASTGRGLTVASIYLSTAEDRATRRSTPLPPGAPPER